MSEEQPRARLYPEWPELCNPLKKFYDPFDEYSAYDGQRKGKKKLPKTVLDEKIDSYSYFRITTKKEVRNPFTGEWQAYKVSPPKMQNSLLEEEQQTPQPPREEYGPMACP